MFELFSQKVLHANCEVMFTQSNKNNNLLLGKLLIYITIYYQCRYITTVLRSDYKYGKTNLNQFNFIQIFFFLINVSTLGFQLILYL